MSKTTVSQKASKQINMTFEEFRLLDLKFSMNKEFLGAKTSTISPTMRAQYNYFEEQNLLRVTIMVAQESKEAPYVLEVEGGGIFKFLDKPPNDMIERLAFINCSAIVFPYVREIVADVTRRGGFEPLHMNPMNFVDFYNQHKAEQKKKGGTAMSTTGEKPGSGTYVCNSCGQSVTLDDDTDALPPCPKCNGTEYTP